MSGAAAAAGASDGFEVTTTNGLAPTVVTSFAAVGPLYPTFAWRRRLNHSLSIAREEEAGAAVEEEVEADYIEDSLDAVNAFSKLPIDTADYKSQDHYRLLGLRKLRYKATEDAIDLQYKRMTLRHHPDKKSTGSMTEEDRANNDAYFTCIKLAYEQLSNPDKRRLFDSIDVPESYDVIPKETKDADKFFETFGKAFKINQRWFKTAVPLLGDMTATEEEVEEIYATWYDADSWREFGYYDKENADNANSRDEKRYLEQKNKAERKRLNKEEKSRMIKLIDLTYKCDPRRIIFRAQRKDAKESAAKEKEDAKAAAIKEKADAAAAIEAAATAAADSAKDANEEGRKARAAFAKKAKKMKVTEVTPEQVGAMKGLLSVADMKSCTGLREKEELVKRLLELYEANKEAVDAAVAAL